MKRMKPQPPEGTAKVQQLGGTDSFECLGFGIDAPNYVMLAVVHRPIGSTVRPVCKDGVWYWANPTIQGRADCGPYPASGCCASESDTVGGTDIKYPMIRLMQGDCLERMKEIEAGSVDLTVTSPPYFNAREYSQWQTYDDFLNFLEKVFKENYRITKEGRMCVVNISTIIQPRESRNSESKRIALPFHFVTLMEDIGFKFLEDIIWIKPEGASKNRNGGFFRHRQPVAYKPNVVNEYVFVFQKPMNGLIDKIVRSYKGEIKEKSLVDDGYERSNVWQINPETAVRQHPAPYPIELPNKVIKYYSYCNDVVLDMFMGSGTTGVCCVRYGRKFIGIEKDPVYFEVARKRLEDEMAQGTFDFGGGASAPTHNAKHEVQS